MSETRSLAYVKAHFSEIANFVETEQERVVVTRNGKPSVVILSPDDLDGLEETLEIMSDPEMVEGIREGEAAIEAGDVYSLDEVKAKLNFKD